MSDPQVGELITNYCKFIALCVFYKKPLAVSRQIDPFWHAHVLHTADYAAFCDAVAGQMLHHFPVARGVVHLHLRRAYIEDTLRLHREAFSEPNKLFFPSDGRAAICWCSYEIVDPNLAQAA